jgi:hypothetical protein
MIEIEIPTATEVSIVVAEPIIISQATRLRQKCKMPFCLPICATCLAMFAFLMVIFWNQRH